MLFRWVSKRCRGFLTGDASPLHGTAKKLLSIARFSCLCVTATGNAHPCFCHSTLFSHAIYFCLPHFSCSLPFVSFRSGVIYRALGYPPPPWCTSSVFMRGRAFYSFCWRSILSYSSTCCISSPCVPAYTLIPCVPACKPHINLAHIGQISQVTICCSRSSRSCVCRCDTFVRDPYSTVPNRRNMYPRAVRYRYLPTIVV